MLFIALVALVFGATTAHSQEEIQEIDLDSSKYGVTYVGRTYDSETNQTTFTYTVQVNGDPSLSHFTVGCPLCNPDLALVASTSPQEALSLGLDPTTNIEGLKWGGPLQAGQRRTYSFTLGGNVAEGPVEVAVKAGEFAAVGERLGPAVGEAPLSAEAFDPSETTPDEKNIQPVSPNQDPGSTDTSAAAGPVGEDRSLPQSGAPLPKNISGGTLALAGLVLIVLGTGAISSLWQQQK